MIQVPCTGRVDIIHLLNAFEDGADGVYVAGCLEGECHFSSGNIKARKKVAYVKRVLEDIGIEPERVAMYNLSSAQGLRFAEIARDMVDTIMAIGPTPVKGSEALDPLSALELPQKKSITLMR